MVQGYGAKIEMKEIGILLVFIIGIILILPYLLRQLVKSTATGAVSRAKEGAEAAQKDVSERIESQDAAIERAVYGDTAENLKGIMSYDDYKSSMGIVQQASVDMGEVITPQAVLVRAAEQGKDFGTTMNQYGDRARFEALDPISKSLVIVGEALPRTFVGFSPYEAGKSTREWLGWK